MSESVLDTRGVTSDESIRDNKTFIRTVQTWPATARTIIEDKNESISRNHLCNKVWAKY